MVEGPLFPGLPPSVIMYISSPYAREHEGIMKEIKTFLGLDSASSAQEQEEGQEHKGRQKKPAKQKKED